MRALATLRWAAPCLPEHIDGVDFDGVVRISSDELVLIEITKERDLAKVRSDINKILPTKIRLGTQGLICRAFVILEEEPTSSMREAGAKSHISVISSSEFEITFFDFNSYNKLRTPLPFGSAVDSKTGENDSTAFVPVRYVDDSGSESFSVPDLVKKLIQGTRVALTGDFGTGKSRCVREVYGELSSRIREVGGFPLAVNLRDHWSSANALEILAGHLGNIGLSSSIDNVVRLLNSGALVLLLDGFDEIGAQTYDARVVDRRSLRRHAVRGVRDLIQKSRAGVLVTGRSHFFDSDHEMLESLGLSGAKSNYEILRAPDTFTESEGMQYLAGLKIPGPIPSWLPRKPLIFQLLAELDKSDISSMFGKEFGQFEFWGAFIWAICERESRGVAGAISSSTIRFILFELAAKSRYSNSFLGRLTPRDIDGAYERVVGTSPDQTGMQLLARMCALGRIEPESPDRQFVDYNTIDVLRAESLVNDVVSLVKEGTNHQWIQSLRPMGAIHAASIIRSFDLFQQCFTYLQKFGATANTKKLGEVVSVLTIFGPDRIDFRSLQLVGSELPILNLSERKICNLQLRNSIIGMLLLQDTRTETGDGLQVDDCIISSMNGITSGVAVPEWIRTTDVVVFEAVSNAARIKESPIDPSQRLFLAIVHKIFFQPGAGREEASLLKGGYGQKYHPKLVDQILKILMREGVVERFKGDDGWVYRPVRKHADRMGRIRSQLTLSEDPIWREISRITG